MIYRYVRDLSCEPNIYLSRSTSGIRVGLVPSSMSKPSSYFLTDRSEAMLLLRILFCVSCLSVILSCLFLVTLELPAGKGLTSLLSCMWCFLVICHFPIWCPGSDVAFDRIDSRFLPFSLFRLSITMIPLKKNKMSTRIDRQIGWKLLLANHFRWTQHDLGFYWFWRKDLYIDGRVRA